MGWKSTIELERAEAMCHIISRLSDLSNEQLADVLETVMEEYPSPLYGHNFRIS